MLRTGITIAAWVALAATPALAGAQSAAAATPAPGTCDCPIGETRGDLRNLAAFAPLGLLGAVAAAGGVPGLFAGRTPEPGFPVATTPLETSTGADVITTDPARNATVDPGDAPPGDPLRPVLDAPPTLRKGVRPPATGTPLPSVFLLGSGLIAVGCVAIIRTRG